MPLGNHATLSVSSQARSRLWVSSGCLLATFVDGLWIVNNQCVAGLLPKSTAGDFKGFYRRPEPDTLDPTVQMRPQMTKSLGI